MVNMAHPVSVGTVDGGFKVDESDLKTVAAVERAILILKAFAPDRVRLSLAELAEATGLYKSTILRLVQTLGAHALVSKAPDGLYQLGPACLQLASVYQQSIDPMDVIVPELRELAASTKESVAFNVPSGENRVCIYRVESPHRVRYYVRLGEIIPLNQGASGHVLRAFSGAEGRKFDLIRRQGFAVTAGEVTPDAAAIAAPVFGAGNELIGALTVSGPKTRLNQIAIRRIEPMVRSVALSISERLGSSAAPGAQDGSARRVAS